MDWWLNASFIDVDQLIPVARAAEEAGFAGLSIADHLVLPERPESAYPYSSDGRLRWSGATPWPDAWVAIAAMAAVTTRLRFTTSVYIAPLREPFDLAKSIGTAAAISGGRLACGFGTGWMREEFDLARQPFEHRGERLDELIAVLRLLWKGGMAGYAGKHYAVPPVQLYPPAPGHVPVLLGGHAPPAMRRAARNDGWIGVHKQLEGSRRDIARVRELHAGLAPADAPFEVIMTIERWGIPDVPALGEAGADGVILPLVAVAPGPELEGRIEGIRRLAAEVMA